MDEPIAPPSAAPVNRVPGLILIITAAVLVLIAVLIMYFQQKDGRFIEFAFARLTPIGEEAVVLKDGELASPTLGMEGQAVSYLKASGVEVALVRTLAATSTGTAVVNPFKVDAYLLGAAPRQLTSDGMPKTGLAVSADGQTIAYAYLDASKNPQVLLTPTLADWRIALVDVASGAVTDLGQGYRPQLVDGILVYAALDGIHVYSIADGAGVTSSLISGAAAVSLDLAADGGHLIYRDPVTLRHAIFAVSALYPELVLAPVGQSPASFIDAAVSGDTLYGLASNEAGGTEVRAFALDDLSSAGTIVHSFPAGSLIGRLIPQE